MATANDLNDTVEVWVSIHRTDLVHSVCTCAVMKILRGSAWVLATNNGMIMLLGYESQKDLQHHITRKLQTYFTNLPNATLYIRNHDKMAIMKSEVGNMLLIIDQGDPMRLENVGNLGL